jgi:hypothetical protein
MALQRRRSTYHIASRVRVPKDLRHHVGRSEIVKSLKTTSANQARLRAAQWDGHVAALFSRLRQNGAVMNREPIGALVSPYLEAELQEVELRLGSLERQ